MKLPVDAIAPDPAQPRKVFDEAALGELAQSIEKHGLIEPIVVRRVPPLAVLESGEPGDPRVAPAFAMASYSIVAGERRWRAAKIAGLLEVPAVIRDSDEDAFEVAVAENTARVNLTAMEEARAYAVLRARGSSEHEIAVSAGRSVEVVRSRLSLLDLDVKLQEAVERKVLSTGLAEVIARLADKEQQYMALRAVLNGATRGQLEKLVASLQVIEQSWLEPDEEAPEQRRARRDLMMAIEQAAVALAALTDRKTMELVPLDHEGELVMARLMALEREARRLRHVVGAKLAGRRAV